MQMVVMTQNNINTDYSINTIIGPNTNVAGDLEAGGFTRIDGGIRGDVRAKGRVVIGERARIKGNVTGKDITIGGVVCGNIIADGHLIILSSAIIMGDIISRRIQADDGCFINGRIAVCQNDEDWSKTVTDYRDAQGVRTALPVFNKVYG